MRLRRTVHKALFFASFMQDFLNVVAEQGSVITLCFREAGLKFSPGEWLALPRSFAFSSLYPGSYRDTNKN